MTEKMLARVAVSSVPYAADRLYTYLVPDELIGSAEAGKRVTIPFGRGNRRVEGFLLEVVREAAASPLKPIDVLLDDAPLLDAKDIRLVRWMKARYFCTYYDAIKTILPGGVWLQYRELWHVNGEISAEDALSSVAPDSLEETLLRAMLSAKEIERGALDELGGEKTAKALRSLEACGLAVRETKLRQRLQDKSVRMVSLCVSAEDALAAVEPKRRSAPVRYAVVELLSREGCLSSSEISYYTGATMQTLRGLKKAGLVEFSEREVLRVSRYDDAPAREDIVLNGEQQAAFDGLCTLLGREGGSAALLHGVTASGKTQVYLRLIAHALETGKSAIVLVPEIGLTPQVLRQFAAQFGDLVAVLHSALSAGERYDSFKKIKTGRARVVIGTRSAVFAPVRDLGIIIIDEEQDGAYKSEQSPRYHARDVAKYRAVQADALLVLGSATPSVETYYGAKQGKYPVFRLTERFLGAGLPEVLISDMRGQTRAGRSGVIGADLERELLDTLDRGRQAILFLNRRGNSRVIGCAMCGWVPECPHCSTNMTYHSASGRAMCHYCGASVKITGTCPVCGGEELFTETPGTQRVEQELNERFPDARVLRMDADTMNTKGAHEKLFSAFAKGEADILLGTQMVTKGLDFENVTLVGVLDADQSLYAQDYRARERTFSLITQVVGRAGRRFDTGRAVIQTYSPTHPVILTAARQDYEKFYESEMETREALRCPPVCTFTVLTAAGEVEQQVLKSLLALKNRLLSLMEGQYADVKAPVLGPAAAQVVKVMGRYRYHLTMRARDSARFRGLVSGVLREFMLDSRNRGVTVFADSNPDL